MASLRANACRFWFNATFVPFLIVFAGMTWLITLACRLVKVPKETAQSVCAAATSWLFWLWFKLNPHVRIEGADRIDWDQLLTAKDARSPLVCANHTSFLDPFIFISLPPTRLVMDRHVRCMMAVKLFSYPLIGRSMGDHLGSFPVHFRQADSHSDDFGVDKERQGATMATVDAHLARGGGLLVCPEGSVSDDPPRLKMFRKGSFALAQAHGCQIWGFAMLGNHECWPKRSAVGGFPCTIRLSLFPCDEPSKADESAEELAARVEARMAEELHEMGTGRLVASPPAEVTAAAEGLELSLLSE